MGIGTGIGKERLMYNQMVLAKRMWVNWSHGLMVMTADFESANLGSIPSGT
jgi:hypothetical protein